MVVFWSNYNNSPSTFVLYYPIAESYQSKFTCVCLLFWNDLIVVLSYHSLSNRNSLLISNKIFIARSNFEFIYQTDIIRAYCKCVVVFFSDPIIITHHQLSLFTTQLQNRVKVSLYVCVIYFVATTMFITIIISQYFIAICFHISSNIKKRKKIQ